MAWMGLVCFLTRALQRSRKGQSRMLRWMRERLWLLRSGRRLTRSRIRWIWSIKSLRMRRIYFDRDARQMPPSSTWPAVRPFKTWPQSVKTIPSSLRHWKQEYKSAYRKRRYAVQGNLLLRWSLVFHSSHQEGLLKSHGSNKRTVQLRLQKLRSDLSLQPNQHRVKTDKIPHNSKVNQPRLLRKSTPSKIEKVESRVKKRGRSSQDSTKLCAKKSSNQSWMRAQAYSLTTLLA